MNPLLEKHVSAERRVREEAGQLAFEQKYPNVLPLLQASDVQYLVEQDLVTAGGQRWLTLFRWAGGYLYTRRWPLLPDGAVEYKQMSVGTDLLAEVVLEEVSTWDKWAAAQAWLEKRRFWIAGAVVLATAAFWTVVLFLLLPDDVTLTVAAVTLLPCLVVWLGVLIDRNRHFPQGWTPKPSHILHHSKVSPPWGGRVTFSSSNGKYQYG